MRRALVTVAAMLAFGATTAGCSPGRHASATASPSVNDQARALSIGLEFAQCARQHGRPNFPDPAIQDGTLAFPGATKEDQLAVSTQKQVRPNPSAVQCHASQSHKELP